MIQTTISSREFNQKVSNAKRSANKNVVFITDRGEPTHVLMSIAHYQRITEGTVNIADLLAMPCETDFDLELPRTRETSRPADLA